MCNILSILQRPYCRSKLVGFHTATNSSDHLCRLHDPHELFLTRTCGVIDISMIVHHVEVKFEGDRRKEFRSRLVKKRKATEFYCRFGAFFQS